MKYQVLINYEDVKFRRITGISPATFSKMVDILRKSYDGKHNKRGRHSKLSIEDMMPAALEYWREYRTYAHIAASYGVHESNIFRAVKRIENVLYLMEPSHYPVRKLC